MCEECPEGSYSGKVPEVRIARTPRHAYRQYWYATCLRDRCVFYVRSRDEGFVRRAAHDHVGLEHA